MEHLIQSLCLLQVAFYCLCSWGSVASMYISSSSDKIQYHNRNIRRFDTCLTVQIDTVHDSSYSEALKHRGSGLHRDSVTGSVTVAAVISDADVGLSSMILLNAAVEIRGISIV